MEYIVNPGHNGLVGIGNNGILEVAACFPEDLTKGASLIYEKGNGVRLTHLAKFAQTLFPDGRVFVDESTIFLDSSLKKVAGTIKFCDVPEIILYKNKYCLKPLSIKLAGEREERELELWEKYKKGDRKAKNELIKSMKPIVHARIKPWIRNSPLPSAAVEAEGMRLMGEALDTFEPGKGAQLKTHVWNRLNKIHRYGYTYQNVGSIPEPRAAKVGTFQNTEEFLRDKLNRDPTADELRQELGWKLSDVISMQKELRGDLMLDHTLGPVNASESDIGAEALNIVYFDASPTQKKVMEYTFDEFKNVPTLDNATEIAKKVKIAPNDVRKEHRWIADEIKKVLSASPLSSFGLSPEAINITPWSDEE
jgi:DNA-directed RNA polymerase specialized sigma subunit